MVRPVAGTGTPFSSKKRTLSGYDLSLISFSTLAQSQILLPNMQRYGFMKYPG